MELQVSSTINEMEFDWGDGVHSKVMFLYDMKVYE